MVKWKCKIFVVLYWFLSVCRDWGLRLTHVQPFRHLTDDEFTQMCLCECEYKGQM